MNLPDGMHITVGKSGLYELRVDNKVRVVRPVSRRVIDIAPGDIMYMDENSFTTFLRELRDPPTIVTCFICGTKIVLGTKCYNCTGVFPCLSENPSLSNTTTTTTPDPSTRRKTLNSFVRTFLNGSLSRGWMRLRKTR